MDAQSANLAKRMQLEETLEQERLYFKESVIRYNELTSNISELKGEQLILGHKINSVREFIKSLEMDIQLLNKTNKEIDEKAEEQFKLVGDN